MKRVLIFAAFLGVAYAGVRTLPPHQTLEKLRQFNELCESGRVPETGQLLDLDGSRTWVYCKREKGQHKKQFTHRANFESPAQYPQTVFLRPADWYLSHDVIVDAVLKSGGTNIYVVPPKIRNDVTATVRPDVKQPDKPRVFFLNSTSSDSGSGATSTNTNYQPPQQPTLTNYPPPTSIYGAPTNQNIQKLSAPGYEVPPPFQANLQVNPAGGRFQRQIGRGNTGYYTIKLV